jgi:hypothetical protein
MKTFAQAGKSRTVLECEDLIDARQIFAETMIGKKFSWNKSYQSSGLVVWHCLRSGSAQDLARMGLAEHDDMI